VVFGKSGLPWSALAGQPRPHNFELPNAHEASLQIVRVDVHESLGDREARDSVQHQSFDAWEHIIVDDGSNDGTAEEVTMRALTDVRIRYVQRTGETSGANVCRNIGVRESQ